MRSTAVSAKGVAPLLFRHATPRTSSDELPGHYDTASKLWVIPTDDGFVPLVEAAGTASLETSTSTRVRQEGDDDDATRTSQLCATLLDTSTLTKVRQESSDDDLSNDGALGGSQRVATLAASAALELETRSLNNQEGIDSDWPRMLLELQTKSFTNVEQDDDSSLAH